MNQVVTEQRPCHTCDGTGRVPLEDFLSAVLNLCRDEVTATQVGEGLGIAANAARNRLMTLHDLGLVTRRATSSGQRRIYLYRRNDG